MNAITPEQALLIMWLTFTAVAALGVCGILVWAVRSGQFSKQDRARYLPLMSGIPGAGKDVKRGESAGDDHVPA